MKRVALVRQLEELGAVFVREGGKHTIYMNPRTSVALKEHLARKLLREAER